MSFYERTHPVFTGCRWLLWVPKTGDKPEGLTQGLYLLRASDRSYVIDASICHLLVQGVEELLAELGDFDLAEAVNGCQVGQR